MTPTQQPLADWRLPRSFRRVETRWFIVAFLLIVGQVGLPLVSAATDAVSRVVTAANSPTQPDASSRVVTATITQAGSDATSRPVTAFNTLTIPDALARVVTAFNGGGQPDALARAVTAYNDFTRPNASSRLAGVFHQECTPCVVVSSDDPAMALPVTGTLPAQLTALNAGPPAYVPAQWAPVYRKDDNSTTAAFRCESVPSPLLQPYLKAPRHPEARDEVTYDNCNSAFYRFQFELPAQYTKPVLVGMANVDDQGVLFLNGNRVTGSMTVPNCDPGPSASDPCYDLQDTGKDRFDPQNRGILTRGTMDTFASDNAAWFHAGTNELVFAVAGQAEYYKPTGVEFNAQVAFRSDQGQTCTGWEFTPGFDLTLASGSKSAKAVHLPAAGPGGSLAVLQGNPGVVRYYKPDAWGAPLEIFNVATGAAPSDFEFVTPPDAPLGLIATNYGSATITYRVADAGLSWSTRQTITTTGSNPISVAVGRFAAPGAPGTTDVAVCVEDSGLIQIYRLGLDGLLTLIQSIPVAGSPVWIETANLDNLNYDEIVVCCSLANTVVVLRSQANGSYVQESYAVSPRPYHVAIGDLNSDSRLDLAVASTFGESLSLLMATANSTFTGGGETHFGAAANAVALGDWNGDAKTDIAVSLWGAQPRVRLLLGDGLGTFQPGADYPVPTAPNILATCQWTSDGYADLIVPCGGEARVVALYGGPCQPFTTGITEPDQVTSFGHLRCVSRPEAGSVEFTFNLPERAEAILSIFDVAGRLVDKLEILGSSSNSEMATWPKRSVRGGMPSQGIYFASLRARDVHEKAKFILRR